MQVIIQAFWKENLSCCILIRLLRWTMKQQISSHCNPHSIYSHLSSSFRFLQCELKHRKPDHYSQLKGRSNGITENRMIQPIVNHFLMNGLSEVFRSLYKIIFSIVGYFFFNMLRCSCVTLKRSLITLK